MKMRINDVLECANKAIDEIRRREEVPAKGHFVSTTEVKKAMGPYKQCIIRVIYVNLDRNINTDFCGANIMERCLSEKEESLITKAEEAALVSFFMNQHTLDIWEQIIEGEYGTK